MLEAETCEGRIYNLKQTIQGTARPIKQDYIRHELIKLR